MTVTIHAGDCLDVLPTLPESSAHCIVTSPPYFVLRDYGIPPSTWPEIEFSPMAGLPSMRIPAMDCCLGLEADLWAFIGHLVHVFRLARRVLRDDGTLWLNLGDSYAGNGAAYGDEKSSLQGARQSARMGARRIKKSGPGLKSKDLIGIPWRVAFALQADGWYLRQDIIWSKPNPMPESVKDRCTKAHEYLFLLSKGPRYYFDADAISEEAELDGSNGRQQSPYAQGFARRSPDEESERRSKRYRSARATSTQGVPCGQAQHIADRKDVDYAGRRNKRGVWTVATVPFKEAHFATYPPSLIEPCILAGAPVGGVVLDMFGGSGTTGEVAIHLGRAAVLIELKPENVSMADRRTAQGGLTLGFADQRELAA